jgi:predicted CxxxxCH...CXXCH cytochrome family protein
MTVNWTRGTAGDGVIVLMRANSAVTGVPADGTYSTYTANTAFGSGTLISDGYVAFKGVGTSVTVSGLVAGTTYHVAVFEYKGAVDTSGDNQGTNYLLTPATGSQAAVDATAPTLTTPTATLLEATTATLGANVTADGGSPVTERGTVWNTTGTPTIAANKTTAAGTTGVFTTNVTSLTSGSKIYYRGYATNSAGTGYSPQGTFYTEPSVQASGVNFTALTGDTMTVNWTRGTGGDGVIVLMKANSAVTGTPADGTYTGYTADSAFGSGTLIGDGYVIYKGAGTNVTVTGLAAGTSYHVAVFEYKGTLDTSGVDQGTNYRETPATGSQTAQCVEYVPSSLTFNGVNTAAGNFNGFSMVTATDLTNLEFRVTETTSGSTETVALLDAWTTAPQIANGTWTTRSATFAPSAGANRVIIVHVAAHTNNTNPTTITVDYGNGTTWTPARLIVMSSNNQRRQNWAFYLNEADIAAASGNTIRVSNNNAGNGYAAWIATYSGVEQNSASTGPGYAINDAYGEYPSGAATVTSPYNFAQAMNVSSGGYSQYFTASSVNAEVTDNESYLSGTVQMVGSAYFDNHWKSSTTDSTTQPAMSWTGGAAYLGYAGFTLNPAVVPPSEVEIVSWNADPQEASSVLTDGLQYNLYARGNEAECGVDTYYVGGTTAPGTGQTFTWSACTETKTLTLNTVANPLGGTTASISATGTAGSIKVGTSSPPTNDSPWTYTIPQDSTANVTFYTQGAGDCGTLTDSQTVALATMVAPTITDFTIPATVIDTVAPLVIPISTFTATDNVAVIGYMITESATAPGAGDAGWSASAPTSYTVGAYGPYTLYAWAKDAAGNVSASTSASTTVSNCSPTITALTIAASPNPIDAPSPATSTITVTPTGDTVTNAQWSVDGSNWFASGSDYTAPAQSSGSVNVLGRATENTCSTVFNASNQPYTLNYDTRTTDLTTDTASGIQSGMTTIIVSAPYLGDKNGNATFQVDYKLSTGADYTIGTAQTDSDGLSPYQEPLTGLTADETYDIRVTYTDDEGVTGTVTQTFQVTLVSWVDNSLLHNSNRFACSETGFFKNEAECVAAGGSWTYDRKWPVTGNDGEWGTDGANDQYGPIMCSTCHAKGTGNIKRIVTGVTAAKNAFPGDGQPVTFLDATDPNADFGDDSPPGGRTTSDKICEACHSQTDYHRYDTTGQPGGLSHYNNQDCIACHEHKVGFRASCASCHGNPPVDAGTLVSNPGTTGSATAGAHDRHVTDATGPTYDCGVCHGTPFGTGANHTTALADIAVTIDFNAFGTTGNSVVGSYAGQIGVTYDGDNGGTANNTLNCNNVYCHGGTIGGGTPAWDATTSPCGSCHGHNAANPPADPASGTSHATHAGNGGTNIYQTGDIALACNNCHQGPFTGGTHVNGEVSWSVGSLGQDYLSASVPAYGAAASGSTGNLAPSNPYQTCSNLACHWGTTTPLWNNGPASCTTCHNNGNDSGLLVDAAPSSGKHADHVDANETYVTCDNCHGTNASSGLHSGHINFQVDFFETVTNADNNLDATDFSGEATRGDTRDDTCAVVCHKDGDWGDGSVATTASVPANRGTLDWTVDCSSVQVVDACTDCHSGTYSGYAGPTVIKNWTTTPTGSHLKAATTDTLPGNACADVVTWKNQCNKCHTKHSGPVQVPLPPTYWDNPGTAAVETTNMQTQLGISYAGADHGAIKLGGTTTSGSTEADVCWNCHGTSETVNEWGYNQDTNGASFPVVTIADRNAGTAGSHNYGYIYTTSARTTKASAWVDASGNGYWHQDGYSTAPQLQRRITSVHSVNFDGTAQVSSIGTAVDANGVLTATAQETSANIRCSYCHDVHDLDLAVADTNTGRPFLRGSWMGNPYAPDMPPLAGYTYPTTGGPQGIGNRWAAGSGTNPVAVPRLWTSTSMQAKGGYFLDQNSGWPTQNTSYNTLAKTAGICTTCHGTDVDNMDFYSNSTASTNLWRRASPANGHANAALGGAGAASPNASNIFDGRRGATDGFYMALQDMMTTTDWGKRSGPTGQQVKGTAPFGSTYSFQPEDGGTGPARNLGWYGGTENTLTRGAQYGTWYTGNTTLNTAGSIGNNGTTARAHDFTCSKCHSPHASGLPALLITNCLDRSIGTWTANANSGRGTIGPNGNSAWLPYVQNNCHRKDSTTSGWHRLATGQ